MIMSWLFDNTYEIFLTEVHHLLHRDVPRGTGQLEEPWLSIIFLLPGDQICEVLLLASKIGPEAPLFLTLKHQLRLRILCYGKGLRRG